MNYIRYYAHICVAQYARGVSSRAPISQEKMHEAFKLGNELAQDIVERRDFAEQTKIIQQRREYFKKIMQMRKQECAEEYQ